MDGLWIGGRQPTLGNFSLTASVSSRATGTVQCSWGELWRDSRDGRSIAGGSDPAEEGEDVRVWRGGGEGARGNESNMTCKAMAHKTACEESIFRTEVVEPKQVAMTRKERGVSPQENVEMGMSKR